MTAEDLTHRLEGVRRCGDGWTGRCPSHDDRNNSLSFGQGDNGGIVLMCHAGCTAEQVVAALGMKLADLMPEQRNGHSKPQIIKTYPYVDEGGKLLYEVCRFDPKDFRQRQPDGKGGWNWSTKGVRRVPYRLPELLKTIAESRPVFIVEGEKDVDRLVKEGFAATCNDGGAGKWRESHSEPFKDAQVVIVADRDEPGRKHAQAVAESLAGICRSAKVIELPDVDGKPTKDASDFFNFGGTAAQLNEIVKRAESSTPIIRAQQLGELVRPNPSDDPKELLKHRFLCRDGGLLLVGSTGIGKSSFEMQCAILWSLGREAFGIVPARPLKSLLIQAENDDADIAEMRDGVIAGIDLTPGVANRAFENVFVYREDSHTAADFFASVVRPLLVEHRPDLLWIDPALAYLGGESASQEDVGEFLRNRLNPLIREFNCGCVVVHHTNKPPAGREKPDWQAGDFAYLGNGSAEWSNWARAVLVIRSLGSPDVFELRSPKRGSRIGWKNPDGTTSYCRQIAHAKQPGVICWRDAEPGEIEPPGRPASHDPEEVFALLPGEGLQAEEWQKLAKSECGVSEATFHRARRSFLKAGRILKSKASGRWQPILKR